MGRINKLILDYIEIKIPSSSKSELLVFLNRIDLLKTKTKDRSRVDKVRKKVVIQFNKIKTS